MLLYGHSILTISLVLGILVISRFSHFKAKSLPNRLIIILEELPRCKIAQSNILMILRIFFLNHI